jgi:hypothetical protein
MDQLPEGVVGVAEFAGDLLLGPAIEEDGAEGLVAAMPRAGGMGEEVMAACVVHRRAPDVSFWPRQIRSSGEFTPGPALGSRGHAGDGGPRQIAGESRGSGDLGMWPAAGAASWKRSPPSGKKLTGRAGAERQNRGKSDGAEPGLLAAEIRV